MPNKMMLIGAGGHSKTVINICHLCGITISGILCEDENQPSNILEIPIIVNDELLDDSDFISKYDFHLSMAKIDVRKEIISKLSVHNAKIKSLFHPSSEISEFSQIENGSLISARTVIGPSTKLEKNVIINTAAVIEHDCIINSNSHIGPGTIMCGYSQCGENVFIGAGAIVLPGVSIGSNSIIGAGAVVTENVPENYKVAGNPARHLK